MAACTECPHEIRQKDPFQSMLTHHMASLPRTPTYEAAQRLLCHQRTEELMHNKGSEEITRSSLVRD